LESRYRKSTTVETDSNHYVSRWIAIVSHPRNLRLPVAKAQAPSEGPRALARSWMDDRT
jgi:hypothetical protein